MNSLKTSSKFSKFCAASLIHAKDDRGQVIIEYVLLLVVAVSAALLITKSMVSRDKSNPGFLILNWSEITKAIAQDKPED